MSKHRDYTKFSNNKPEEKVDAVVEEVVATPAEEVVEETIAEVIANIEPSKSGVIVDCLRLNVRNAPDANADVVCVIDASTKFVVDEAESTDEFYAICTESGAEGYCMKRYIKILP